MNKPLTKSFLLLAAVAAMNYVAGQTKISLHSAYNLVESLAYFEKAAKEPEVKDAVQKVQALYAAGELNDSLAAALIGLEDSLNRRLEEYIYLNYRPYKSETLLSFYQKTADLLQNLGPNGESLFYASAIHNLAMLRLYFDHKQYSDEICPLLEKALCIRGKYLGADDPAYIKSLYGIAVVHSLNATDFNEVLPLIWQVLTLSAAGGNELQKIHADALHLLGVTYTSLQRYNEAARILEQESEVWKSLQGAESPSYALRLYAAGDMLLYTGEYNTALRYLEQALELTRKTLGEESLQFSYCLNGIGSLYYQLGAYKQAVPYFSQALAIKEALKDNDGLPLALHQLATTYVKMGLYAQALPLFQRVCAMAEKGFAEQRGAAEGYGYFLSHLAGIYRVMHQYAKAYPLLQKAAFLTSPENGGDGAFQAMCLQNLALLFQNTNRCDSALFYLKKVLLLKEKKWGKEHFQYASTLYQLSDLYAKMNRLDTALLLCKEAAFIRKTTLGEAHPDYATSLAQTGDLYTSLAVFDTAQQCLQRAMDLREKALGPDHPDCIKSLNSLAKLSLARGDNRLAAELLIKADTLFFNYLLRTYTTLSEQEKLNLVCEAHEQFSLLPSLLYDDSSLPATVEQQAYAAELLLKGMVLDNQQQVLNGIRQGGDSTASALYFSWRTNRTLLAKQFFLPVCDRTIAFDSLEEATDALEENLARRSAPFCRQRSLQATTPKDIGATLKTGEAAIEFVRYHYYHRRWTDSVLYAALVVLPGDSTGQFVPLCEEKQLKERLQSSAAGEPWAIQKLYSATQHPLGNATTSLYNLIWKPLLAYLPGVHTVYFAPAGLLHRVAFAALCSEQGKRLIDQYNLNQVFSTRSLVFAKQPAAKPASASLWAGPAYKVFGEKQGASDLQQNAPGRGAIMQPLPGAQEEIKSIERLCTQAGVRTIAAFGATATEEAFKQFDGNSPELLHIAAHGFFQAQNVSSTIANDPQPNVPLTGAMLGSSLGLAKCPVIVKKANGQQPEDGILTAYEIAQMDLSKTKLAVLSACNTALGELQGSEGVMGLQRALKLAGVKQMIVSLWQVPDAETTELMQVFYKAWLGGKDTRDALRTAQLQIKAKHPSPFYWAAFVLVE